jgi:G3E family GTPase
VVYGDILLLNKADLVDEQRLAVLSHQVIQRAARPGAAEG